MPVLTYSDSEMASARSIVALCANDRATEGIDELRVLKDEIHAAIPEKQRISCGITWVVQRLGGLLSAACLDDSATYRLAQTLWKHIDSADHLLGAPIFLMAEYGVRHPQDALEFFRSAASSKDWIVREFSQGAFRKMIKSNREFVHAWLLQLAQSDQPYLRRFVGETLRPVTDNHWMLKEVDYSLSILRLLFRESDAYPRTSVGNNLSDLSRHNPELILDIVKVLVESGDKNSYWIAYRACRNLVKKYPRRVMDLLRVDEYHYKDRNFFRTDLQP